MFTGLIEAVGTVARLNRKGAGARLEVEVQWPDGEIPAVGASIAVDGACLTVVDPSRDRFSAELSPETLDRTLLSEFRPGKRPPVATADRDAKNGG